MDTLIYYFSATGNSLNVARDLAKAVGNTQILSIPNFVDRETVEVSSKRVGLVFPVYAWGMPRIVAEFIEKLKADKATYIFAVATCVAIQGNTLVALQNALRRKGGDLGAGFAVKAPRSSLMKLNNLDRIIMRLDRKRKKLRTAEERFSEIVSVVKNKEFHKVETSSLASGIFGSLLHGLALNSFRSTDSAFVVDDTCKACGTCADLCPRGNIVLSNGRPTFLHNCELCHACIQWCPQFAIRHPNFDADAIQYTHPRVKKTDLQHTRLVSSEISNKTHC